MICIVSPAKIQNFKEETVPELCTTPQFIEEATSLIDCVRQLSLYQLAKLLQVNRDLALLNMDRHFKWQLPLTTENSKPAVMAFDGEVFKSIGARSMNLSQLNYMQSHLRILSGLYGVLRPLDLVQPYRLDVSNQLTAPTGENLYSFWKTKITTAINQALVENRGEKFVLNLASVEYKKTIDEKLLKAKIIDFEFLEYQDNCLKPVVIYIKKARGMMVRYVVENEIKHPDELKGFNGGGYWYNERLSTNTKMVFVR